MDELKETKKEFICKINCIGNYVALIKVIEKRIF